MSTRHDIDSLAIAKFAVGQPLRRLEDDRLVRGQGQYTDDVDRAGQAYAAFVRSDVAHGRIKAIDTAAARAMPGVLAIYTGADIAKAGYGGTTCRVPFKSRDGTAMKTPERVALDTEKVRYVGDPFVCVIADTAVQAQDATEAITADIEQLAPVLDIRTAAKATTPPVWDSVPDNVVLDYLYGEPDKVAAAFAAAHHVTRLTSGTSASSSTRWSRARSWRSSTSRQAASRCMRRRRACSARAPMQRRS